MLDSKVSLDYFTCVSRPEARIADGCELQVRVGWPSTFSLMQLPNTSRILDGHYGFIQIDMVRKCRKR